MPVKRYDRAYFDRWYRDPARRIWAVAMKEKYGANDRSQKLKYHVQTSGRS